MKLLGIAAARQQGRNIAEAEEWNRTFELVERQQGIVFRSRFILNEEDARKALANARERGTLYPHERPQTGHIEFFVRDSKLVKLDA